MHKGHDISLSPFSGSRRAVTLSSSSSPINPLRTRRLIDERANDQQTESITPHLRRPGRRFAALVAALFAEGRQVRGVERARIFFDIAPDRSHWGTEIAGKVKAWAKALTGPTSVPDKYPQLVNPPGSETGPGQIVTWGKSRICSVDAFGYKFQWATNSSKHIPFDWSGT